MSIGFALWGYLGFRNGLGRAFSSKLFLWSLPGLGIISQGIPIGIVLLIYSAYELYRDATDSTAGARSELILTSAVIGALYGIILKRLGVKPIK